MFGSSELIQARVLVDPSLFIGAIGQVAVGLYHSRVHSRRGRGNQGEEGKEVRKEAKGKVREGMNCV